MKSIVKKCRTLFDQIKKVLGWSYLFAIVWNYLWRTCSKNTRNAFIKLWTFYFDVIHWSIFCKSFIKWQININSIEKIPLFYHFHSKIWRKKCQNSNIQFLGGIIKLTCRSLGIIFCNSVSTNNFQNKRSHLGSKNLPKLANWSKYSTISPEEYYYIDTIKRLREPLLLENISK